MDLKKPSTKSWTQRDQLRLNTVNELFSVAFDSNSGAGGLLATSGWSRVSDLTSKEIAVDIVQFPKNTNQSVKKRSLKHDSAAQYFYEHPLLSQRQDIDVTWIHMRSMEALEYITRLETDKSAIAPTRKLHELLFTAFSDVRAHSAMLPLPDGSVFVSLCTCGMASDDGNGKSS